MVVHVAEITSGKPEEIVSRLRHAHEQAALFVVLCVDEAGDTVGSTDALSAIIDQARSRAQTGSSAQVLTCGDLKMDRDKHEVTRAGRTIQLAPMEYALLEFLLEHRDRAMTEELIMQSVFRANAKNGRFNTLWVHVHRLRRKIDRDGSVALIHTIKGVGYILKSPAPQAQALHVVA